MTMAEEKQEQVRINLPESIGAGVYTNNMVVRHTREEFIMDFMLVAPPQGQVTARVIASPTHMKRILDAIASNIEKFEEKFGEIPEPDENEEITVTMESQTP